MSNKKMSTLTIGENTYEVVDETARAEIETLKETGGGGVDLEAVVEATNNANQAVADTYAWLEQVAPLEDALSEKIGEAETAIENANNATELASNRASLAEVAAINANEKAQYANDAAEYANDNARGADNIARAMTEKLAEINTMLENGEFNGKDGTSVTVKSVTESTESGGSNVVTFSDGKTLTVKNGKDANVTSENIIKALGYTPSMESVDILLPASDVAVVGREYNIYKEAVVFSSRPVDEYDIAIYLNETSVQAYNYQECWRFTPTVTGTYTLTITVRDIKTGNNGIYATKTMTLYVVENAETMAKNVLFIGDSLTYAGIYTAEIEHNLSNGGITSVGTIERTRTINGVTLTSMCEGRNGWATWDYAGTKADSTSKFLSAENVFRNPSTNKFDLAYYMQTYHAGVELNAVCLNLGTNGIGAHISVITGMNELIARIRDYSATLPILIHIPIPVAKQDYRAYITTQKNASSPYMRMRWYDLAKAYIDEYDGTMSNVYLMPVYFNMDVNKDFPTQTMAASARNPEIITRVVDGHPNTYGYLKMADVYYAHLLRYMYDDGATYYTVTNNLTNVINSNSSANVKEGSAYSATLTALSGYKLETVSATMGGNAVTVTNGVISIASVTGNIVITANAVEEAVSTYTNLARPETANDASPNTALTADEWLNGYYISSKKISAKSDVITTNKIPLTLTSDKLRIKGLHTSTTVMAGGTGANRFRILSCDASGNALQSEVYPVLSKGTIGTGKLEFIDATELANGIVCFKPSDVFDADMSKNMAFVRICGCPVDGNENVIVTVNEPIE